MNTTHSYRKGNTQSSLEKYISKKTELAKSFGLTYSPIIQGVTYSVSTHSHISNSNPNFQEKFGVIKHNATYSINNKSLFIGTHSSFESKGIILSHTFSYSKQIPITHISSTYSNNGFMLFTQSKMVYNSKKVNNIINSYSFTYSSNSINVINHINAIKAATQSVNKKGFGLTSSQVNMKKFYTQPTSKTKQIIGASSSLINLVSNMVNNPEQMLRTNNVSINGNIITSATYSLSSGDIIRVGVGHYLHNSDQMVKVK